MARAIFALAPGAHMPTYATPGSVGADLYALEDFQIEAGGRYVARTGLFVAVPYGFEMQIRPRSGMASRDGITVLNSPGTIDSDYRDEVKVIMFNTSGDSVLIKKGSRIAQAVIAPVTHMPFEEANELPPAPAGRVGGFGSTGS